jgi:site-specific DNA recombinase
MLSAFNILRNKTYSSIEQEIKENKKKTEDKKHELDEVQQRLKAVEEKWFKDEINKDTCERWYSTY